MIESSFCGGITVFVYNKNKEGVISNEHFLEGFNRFNAIISAAGIPEDSDMESLLPVDRQAFHVLYQYILERYPQFKNELGVIKRRFDQESGRSNGLQ